MLAVLFGTAVLATRNDPLLVEAPPDRADLALPEGPMTAADVAAVRFSLAPRGYRMHDVDAVLGRLAAELDERDRRIAALEQPPPPPTRRPAGRGRTAGPP